MRNEATSILQAEGGYHRRHLLGGAACLAALTTLPVRAARQLGVSPTGGFLNIRDFGAKGDGRTIDSPAIDRAIEAAASRGGGTVYVPPGTYACYTIHLKSMITLYLDRGATILAASVPLEGTTRGGYDPAEPQDPAIEPFQDYGHNHWRNSLIYGEGLHDIAIVGDGLIWGKGLSRGHPDPDKPKAELPGVGCKSIALKNCRNVQLRDFSVLEGGWFALLATGVDNLVIDNLTVDTNRDGFDIDCCKNVRVSNCTVNSPYDDAIVPKSSFALGYARPTENVTITNCHVTGSYVVGTLLDATYKPLQRSRDTWLLGRIKCGTESNGGFKNITISNCVFDKCWGLALETVDGAIMEDIAVSNITMRDCLSAPLFLRLGRRMRGPKGVPVGSMRRVLIDNVTCMGTSLYPAIVAGVEGFPVEDVKISNVFLSLPGGGDAAMAAIDPPEADTTYPDPDRFGPLPASGFFVRHARNIELSHVEVRTRAADARPAVWLGNVDGCDITGLKVPAASPVFAQRSTTGLRAAGIVRMPTA
ncbi:glycoside hydrolase family 28 protein [Sphingomonas sp. AP4-R1]|uniref:rhamnogalacturonidase n=1 Tax=Sphingomonas sp. AP4-R1 TaxID=2735134 RepID=UPI0014938892|nr:glycoside hydrolase family 28 protein [Sphingomonas sp. AP4-R1]QJU57763.1 glycoside hydrolase family 28 protein [Sphingomonas sp. AP4-R1]